MSPEIAASRSTQNLRIKRIKRSATLSNQVTTQLEHLIVEQKLGDGDRLPTERDLAERFEVSRTVVREAVRSLVSRGVLQVNPGSGTLIRRPSADVVTQTMSHYLRLGQGGIDHDKITEVRRVLEVEIAGLAAARHTEKDVTELRAILDRFDDVRNDRSAFAKWDVSFHLQVASATQNELLHLLLNSISGIMTTVREIGFSVPGANENALRHHTAIFKHIEAGNVDGARQAMRKHIEDSERVLAKGQSGSPTPRRS